MSTSARKNTSKIMVFGTFDGVHAGHLHFFREARRLSTHPFLIVSIARDANVRRIKGKRPRFGEKKRAALVKKTGLADKVVLGGLKNHIPHIIKERPDIVALGYDQKAYVKNLKKDLALAGLPVILARLSPYKEKKYKNSILLGKGGV